MPTTPQSGMSISWQFSPNGSSATTCKRFARPQQKQRSQSGKSSTNRKSTLAVTSPNAQARGGNAPNRGRERQDQPVATRSVQTAVQEAKWTGTAGSMNARTAGSL